MKNNNGLKIFNGLWMKSAFSLMEMMIVLLIISIIAAATAPMVSKKMAANVGSGDSPWVFSNTAGSISYNMGAGDMSAIIGATSYDANGSNATFPRLVLSGDNGAHPAMVFATGNPARYSGQINMTQDSVYMNGGSGDVGQYSVAMGKGQTHSNYMGTVALGYGATVQQARAISIGQDAANILGGTKGIDAISIGHQATASRDRAIAIGSSNNAVRTSARGLDSIAIGSSSTASAESSISIGAGSLSVPKQSVAIGSGARNLGDTYEKSVAIGNRAETNSQQSIAIGNGANTNAYRSIAIGDGATVPDNAHSNSMAIGPDARTTGSGQIVLGTTNHTVHIPGSLVVGGNVILNTSPGHYTALRPLGSAYGGDAVPWMIGSGYDDQIHFHGTAVTTSDKRLKNVGKKYESGLAELKKLDLYHYTFKADKDKTPQVGVMAQDLQKVFPTAVTKGPDGYLRIRRDEMFYAVINAVKELDARLSELASKVQAYFDRTEKLEAQVKAQDKIIKDLTARIEKLEKLK